MPIGVNLMTQSPSKLASSNPVQKPLYKALCPSSSHSSAVISIDLYIGSVDIFLTKTLTMSTDRDGDVKAEKRAETKAPVVSADGDDDINHAMLSQPLEPGTKAARYSGPPRGGRMVSFRPGVFRRSHRPFLKCTDRELKKQEKAEEGGFTKWRTNPDEIDESSIPVISLTEAPEPALSFHAFHATVIEPNNEAIELILVEYNKSVHMLDQRNDTQFFERYHGLYTSGVIGDQERPRTNFSLRPDKALNKHIGFLCSK
jgi:hypothetical protein